MDRRGRARRTIAAGSLAIAAVAVPGAPSSAQAPEPPAAWRVECTGDGKTLDCRAVQQIIHRETRQLVASVLVRQPRDSKTPVMMIQLPLALNLTEPVSLKVDNAQPERHPIQTCTNAGCFVGLTVNDKLFAALRAGAELKLGFQDANKKPIEVGLPLLGFALAFDKAK